MKDDQVEEFFMDQRRLLGHYFVRTLDILVLACEKRLPFKEDLRTGGCNELFTKNTGFRLLPGKYCEILKKVEEKMLEERPCA